MLGRSPTMLRSFALGYKTAAPLFLSLMFAAFHYQSPLPTIVYIFISFHYTF